ncbi:C40 family peptidase [Adhaeribacter rhizoryzae]|uniref:NlpC/P60 family protein n=1 Tax=Adhaeribacter rhizoryzae TaxID=2607907 RepID=A0A5M6D7H7_9BACT|nr:C40 family peptidase [Adhaeribacter rhizoryzae]KAA5543504.1 NlpC/P60 family protein [Adhaeribacter rhizoryzae]
MKLAWIIFGSLIVLLLAYGLWNKENIRHENLASEMPQTYSDSSRNGGIDPEKSGDFFSRIFKQKKQPAKLPITQALLADSIVSYGLSLIGTPYLPAGITCEGFDCSGFVYHIYQKYGIKLPHSSAMLMQEGKEVPLTEARKGDLIVFTGTDENDTTPGHVGVVITEPGQPVEFVHASSATRQGGVKISKVDSTGYEKRFLQVRRVL